MDLNDYDIEQLLSVNWDLSEDDLDDSDLENGLGILSSEQFPVDNIIPDLDIEQLPLEIVQEDNANILISHCNVDFLKLDTFFSSLRWYILSKHSHLIFSENTNTEDSHEDKSLNDSECITSELFNNLEMSEKICNDHLETESHNTCLKETDIPELHFDLLKQFELNTEEPFNNIEKEYAEFVAGYVANRFFPI
ncbi:hypothetical protein QTP88_008567 [Uroleucon formosanum]